MPSGPQQHCVLHAASEVVGFAKTGGLADVAGSLPRALADQGRPCAVITPLYRCTRKGKVPLEPTHHLLRVPLGEQVRTGRLWRAKLPGSDVPIYLVEEPELFERDDPGQGTGLYHFTLPDGRKKDYPDNCQRYTFFCRAVLEALPLLAPQPLLLHCHDWQSGLIPVLLREDYARRVDAGLYQRVRTLFTIHNIAYQGTFPAGMLPLTGLSWKLFNYEQLEFFGLLNFLKAGIVFADRITTVSPSYAREIQTPYYGAGLHTVLLGCSHRLSGIVNGVDYGVWDPAHDRHLAANYDAETFAQKKPLCKQALQKRMGLPLKPDVPLLGMISRLVDQKGLDLLSKVADLMLRPGDLQWVILGEGEPGYHRMLEDLKARYPGQVGLLLGFDEALAHQIEAGADIYLMPSQYEPSGLNQLYSLRYGTVPVVRATGGLADTIVDCTPESLAAGTATGFSFLAYTPAAFLDTLGRALTLCLSDKPAWLKLVRTGMRQDWSWDRSAREYNGLYARLEEEE